MKSILAKKDIIKIGDIKDPDVWVNVKVKIIRLWDVYKKESISQEGLLGDETGEIKFVSWKISNLPILEENKSYLIKSVVVDSWNGRLKINLNKTTEIIPMEEDIGTNDFKSEIAGIVKEIIPESGLIFRCPHCKRVLIEDEICIVHEEVEPLSDLRVKARFETKGRSVPIIIRKKVTEEVIEMRLDEAQKTGKQKVLEILNERLVGIPFRLEGSLLNGGYFVVEKIVPCNKKLSRVEVHG